MNMEIILINKVLKELKSFSDTMVSYFPPVKQREIILFEEKYNLKLPEDYKYLLYRTNGLSVMGDTILGIHDISISKNPMNLENTYIFEHFEVSNPMPTHLVPFYPDGYGNHYCFDLHDCKIVFWEWDCDYTKGIPEIVYNCLGELMQEIFIDWTLEDYNYDGTPK